MKTLILTVAAALLSSATIYAQKQPEQASVLSTDTATPLVLVKEQETTVSAILINPDDIESITVVKGAEATKQFAEKGQHGVILLEPKAGLQLVRLHEVYDAFKVPTQERTLTVAVNGKHVKHPELLLADIRQIERVEIADFTTSATRWSFDAQYLNIVTRH